MHLSEEQLNEYLDNETTPAGRTQIESHLSTCEDCAARLAVFRALFAEIESLPELAVSRDLHAAFAPPASRPAPQLPRWLTLTATLQAACALVVIVFAAPVVSGYLWPLLQSYQIPSLKDVVIQLQMYLALWIQSVQTFHFPSVPTSLFTLPKGLSDASLAVSAIMMFTAWAFGNWWLLRKRPNSLA